MFDKILVPLDGSPIAELALSHVLAVTQNEHTSITLLRVIESITSDASVVNPMDWHLRRTEAGNYLDELVRNCTGACDAQVEKVVQEGAPAERILEQAHDHRHDLIVLCSHGRSGLSQWNVSSVALKVIYRAGASILLVRAYHTPEAAGGGAIQSANYRRILVPLDGSLRSEHVLPVAVRLAKQHGAELLLVHGVMRPEVFQQTPLGSEHTAMIERVVEHNRSQAQRYFEDLTQRLDVQLQTFVLADEDMPAALHRFAEEKAVDLVILSAHGRSGEHALPYGSLTTGFVAYGTTHLLILQDLPWQVLDTRSAAASAISGSSETPRRFENYSTPEENGHPITNAFAVNRQEKRPLPF